MKKLTVFINGEKLDLEKTKQDINKPLPKYSRKETLKEILKTQKENRKNAIKIRKKQQQQLEKDVAALREMEQKSNLGKLLNNIPKIPSATIETHISVTTQIREDEELEDMLSNCASRPKLYFHTKYGLNLQALGIKYERFVAEYFESIGYQVEHTPLVHDYGVDLIATRGEEILAIQCKYWEADAGVDAVQQAFAGAAYYSATKSLVVTNNGFTINAKNLANKIGTKLRVIKFKQN